MMGAIRKTWVVTAPDEVAPAIDPTVETLLSLQTAFPREAPVPIREPEPLGTANLKAFHLLREDAPEEYLGQFRQLRSRLIRRRELEFAKGRELRSLVVTSPEPGDGKTFVALNLALMLAVAQGSRVLVGDLNVRRPAFHTRMLLPAAPGIRECLGDETWRACARMVPHMGLYVAPLGEQRFSELDPVDYQQVRRWLSAIRQDFDWIVLDAPAWRGAPDAETLSHIADGTIVVLRKGQSSFQDCDELLAKLDRSRLVGAVLNGLR